MGDASPRQDPTQPRYLKNSCLISEPLLVFNFFTLSTYFGLSSSSILPVSSTQHLPSTPIIF